MFEHKLEISGAPGEGTDALIVPLYIRLDKTTSHLELKLKSILKEFNSHNTASGYKCSAMVLELLADISRCCVSQMKYINNDYTPMQ